MGNIIALRTTHVKQSRHEPAECPTVFVTPVLQTNTLSVPAKLKVPTWGSGARQLEFN